ncbi:MAG TPA: hypothetical protein VIC03_02105 [Gemmatimonadaceae bacterium]|jgi:hypothetical protein
MADPTHPRDAVENSPDALRRGIPSSSRTERLVRETWRHYYVARLAEAQFGPDSLEASIAQSRALTSYRELRGSLREIDPYYRSPSHPSDMKVPAARHLRLVRDEPPAIDSSPEI